MALTLALAAFCASAQAAPELVVLGQGPLEVTAETGKDSTETGVSVLNTGSAEGQVSVSFQASKSAGISATLVGSGKVPAGQAVRVKVKLAGLKGLSEKASGQIVLASTQPGVKPAAQSVTVTPALQPLVAWPATIIGSSLGSAALVILFIFLSLRGKQASDKSSLLLAPTPGPKWSFDSWATHLTGLGALLATAAGSAALPAAPVQIEKESLVALALLFAGVALAGPFIYQAVRRWDAKVSEEEGNWGYAWVLLIACGCTLGALVGQLFTLGLIGWIIIGGGWTAAVLEGGLAILLVLAYYYVTVTARSLVLVDWRKVALEAAEAKLKAAAREGGGDLSISATIQAAVVRRSARAARHLDLGPGGQLTDIRLRLP